MTFSLPITFPGVDRATDERESKEVKVRSSGW